MKTNIKFYKDKVAVNFLAKDAENGKAVYKAIEGHTAIGVLSKQFESAQEGIDYVNEFKKSVPCVSVGLGAGDPSQAIKAATIASVTDPGHVNQVFTSAGYAAGALAAKKAEQTAINVLISPTGTVGKVKISTGERSINENDAIVDVKTALAMLKDMEADAVKFFPMGGLKSIEELKYVAKACADMDISMLEPTGGINLDNFEEILQVCIDAGVKKVMPHVYGAVIDKNTGLTDIEKVKTIYEIVKRIV
ncbi:oxo-acid lyase [Acidaminobacter sp. JC074]|uniref:2-dehydro-3-deoxy-phosphogluconate aldolase n=1 Tax=Acidaminobacter sp. JC074 TaxID=2530199 RepID=UPI001F1115DE|nr:KDGP aldolase [Acidaminobacter sp. JC074]MCH4887921.1 oxo-acid lyase [Acidaminobacter sp. JC074]